MVNDFHEFANREKFEKKIGKTRFYLKFATDLKNAKKRAARQKKAPVTVPRN